jgi:hypothetical protein
MDNEALGSGNTEPENDPDQIPKHRAFNLYGMLICGLIISLTGVYTKITEIDKKPSLYYDGDGFQFGAIDGMYYIFTGIIICIFPAWHLYKGNHKPHKGNKS